MATVRDYMSTEVSLVPPDTNLVEAAQMMRISGVGGVPVGEVASKECVGILTERDIVVRVLAEGREARAVFVRDVATPEPVTCGPGEEVSEAMARMRDEQVQHLPVVEAGKVVGMLSLADVAFRRPDEERGTVVPRAVESR